MSEMELVHSVQGFSYDVHLRQLDAQLNKLKSHVEQKGSLDPKEVKKLLTHIENFEQSKGTFTVTKDCQNAPNILKLLHFFQTSKTAQECLAPTMVALFKSALAKLKTGLSKGSTNNLKKVEKVTKGGKKEEEKSGSQHYG